MTAKPDSTFGAIGDWLVPVVIAFNSSGARSRIGMITGLLERKSEYRIRSVACLFYERV